MTISQELINKIENNIKTSLRKKFQSYKPESKHMPFHYSLLGRDRMALFSFIHSLNTTFGTSIFEPVAETLARNKFKSVSKQYVVGNTISESAQQVIQEIINKLSIGNDPNKIEEIAKIQNVCKTKPFNRVSSVKADLFLEDENGSIYLIDLKTAKPNISNFKDYKRTLLEWVAIYLANHTLTELHSFIAIPYNPYEPKPYQRWTLKGMIDLNEELKVADEFWDFLGGIGAYDEILNCFERVGIEMRTEIDEYFKKFR